MNGHDTMWGAAQGFAALDAAIPGESASCLDLVIETLDEFSAGMSGNCICSTAADYVIGRPAMAAKG